MTIYNFASGPAMMPRDVLRRARDEFLDWNGTGLSVLELPFTGPEFTAILEETAADLRELLGIPFNYYVLFQQGGAYAHFALIAMNLLRGRRSADYVDSGHWSHRAIGEARRYCDVNVVASGGPWGYTELPAPAAWTLDPDAAYCHLTTCETAQGLQIHTLPETGDVPIVADMTSDFLSQPLEVSRYGMIYASAQKNVGPAGLTMLIVREDLLGDAMQTTPAVFNYARQAENSSKVNTPPTYAIYLAGLVFKWLKEQGGMAAMAERNRRKAKLLYDVIDASDYYHCAVDPAWRSTVNVCFRLPTMADEKEFLRLAGQRGLINLNGHSAVGGIRASLYNAMSEEGVAALATFMEEFAARRHRSVGDGSRLCNAS